MLVEVSRVYVSYDIFGRDMPGYARIEHVRTGEYRLVNIRSGYVRLVEVRSRYSRLG
jgi:hypothetical protein